MLKLFLGSAASSESMFTMEVPPASSLFQCVPVKFDTAVILVETYEFSLLELGVALCLIRSKCSTDLGDYVPM